MKSKIICEIKNNRGLAAVIDNKISVICEICGRKKLQKLKIFNLIILKAMKKETWKFVLQTLAAILTAIATSLGVQSCMTMM